MEHLTSNNITFLNPFLSFESEEIVGNELVKVFSDIPTLEILLAVKKAWNEQALCHIDIQKKGEEVLSYIEKNEIHGIVLAGRPYHIDPEINHGIPELITSYNIAVLTEDSISHLAKPERDTV